MPSDTHKEQDRAQTIKEINDTLLVVFTALLVVVGFLQWRTLHHHEKWMERNVEIVTKIAEAAKKNAEIAEVAVKLSECADL